MEASYSVVVGSKITGAVDQNVIDSVAHFSSIERAMEHVRFLTKGKQNAGYVQLGTDPNSALTMHRSARGDSWAVLPAPVWSPKDIEAHTKQLATLRVPYTNGKEMRMRLGWGYKAWVRELFAEKFGVVFKGEGTACFDKASCLEYSCYIPAEAERALTQSYGCTIRRLSGKYDRRA